jgi:hypothetical protein
MKTEEAYVGVVRDGVITLKSDAKLMEGTEVLITPMDLEVGNPAALIAALDRAPKVPSAWVDELETLIAEGQRPARYVDPFAEHIVDEKSRP